MGSESTAPTRVSEFFNRYEAMVDFEKQFLKKTGGDKWKDKDWLAVGANRNAKPGMFKLINREQDKELLKTLTQQQNLVLSIIKESSEKNQITKFKDEQVQQLIAMAWDLDLMKAVMQEMCLDLEKLPMGKLTKEQIAKAYKILKEIQNVMLTQKK